eukprot:1266117-Lingulodinium_polyedra.AAC.1
MTYFYNVANESGALLDYRFTGQDLDGAPEARAELRDLVAVMPDNHPSRFALRELEALVPVNKPAAAGSSSG